MRKKTQKAVEALDHIIEFLKSDHIYKTYDYKSRSEFYLKGPIHEALRNGIREYYFRKNPHYRDSTLDRKVMKALTWEGDIKKSIAGTKLFSVSHRPDYVVELDGIRTAIEIKCDDYEKLDMRDKAAITGALHIIDDLVRQSSPEKAKEIREHIGFASFNTMALERIAEVTGGRHDLFFIVASNRALGWIATKTIYPHFNYLGKRLKKVLSRSEYLTGAWFDPCAVKDFSRIFNAINRERQGNPLLQPLKVYISTYLLEEREYFHRLEKDREKVQHVEGLFFEIKSL